MIKHGCHEEKVTKRVRRKLCTLFMMSETQKCCGCFGNLFGSLQHDRKRGRWYRRARYNEREYSIEEDFRPSRSFVVSEEERQLVANGRYDVLIEHQKRTDAAIEEELRRQEEDLRLEEEAYTQAKNEAAKVSTQSTTKKAEKATVQSQRAFDSDEFTSWLSQENLEVNSPELDVEDFDSFLEKVKARSLAGSAKATDETTEKSAIWEDTMNQGLEATKIAGNALSALSPVDDDDIQRTGSTMDTKSLDDDDELLI
ncbi:uncharacterized protein LOC135690026 isoform X2 [Rhopilema esculentum]|uniref:uncharacterized protein LOC135690026 isoform X2 n=1 Tax=Rhopilema esculentum TaxID=499914 RepID=UPI0031CF81E9